MTSTRDLYGSDLNENRSRMDPLLCARSLNIVTKATDMDCLSFVALSCGWLKVKNLTLIDLLFMKYRIINELGAKSLWDKVHSKYETRVYRIHCVLTYIQTATTKAFSLTTKFSRGIQRIPAQQGIALSFKSQYKLEHPKTGFK